MIVYELQNSLELCFNHTPNRTERCTLKFYTVVTCFETYMKLLDIESTANRACRKRGAAAGLPLSIQSYRASRHTQSLPELNAELHLVGVGVSLQMALIKNGCRSFATLPAAARNLPICSFHFASRLDTLLRRRKAIANHPPGMHTFCPTKRPQAGQPLLQHRPCMRTRRICRAKRQLLLSF